jgi:hypothetical protein
MEVNDGVSTHEWFRECLCLCAVFPEKPFLGVPEEKLPEPPLFGLIDEQ